MYEQKAQFGVIDDPSYISILNSSDDDDGLQLKFYVSIYFLKYFCLSHKPSRNIKNVYVATTDINSVLSVAMLNYLETSWSRSKYDDQFLLYVTFTFLIRMAEPTTLYGSVFRFT